MIALPWEGDWPISQLFGERPTVYARFGLAGHNGLDVACPLATRIRALWDGEVVEVANDHAGYGWYVRVRSAGGWEALYAHLTYPNGLEIGAPLAQGSAFAKSGASGNVTGPHLHLGVRADWRYRGGGYGGYVDPLPYLLGK